MTGKIRTIAFVALLTSHIAAAATPPAAALQAIIDRATAANPNVPGIALTWSGPDGSWSGAAGRRSLGRSAPLAADQPFRIASITKVFVAATILRLAEAGRLSTADPIVAHISAATADQLRRGGHDPAAIRIEQLMAHSSGLADHSTADAFVAATLTGSKQWTRQSQLALLAGMKPVGKPGAAFHYSDSGYLILGEIIERSSGQPLATAVRSQLHFDRLKLRSTWWEHVERPPAGVKPRASQYQGSADTTAIDPTFDLFGGGGLVSTTADLTVFFRALLQGRLFDKPQTLALALATPYTDFSERNQFHALVPFGLRVGNQLCWSHGGHWGSMAFYCPGPDIAVAYTVNQNESALYRGLAADLAPLIDAID